MVLHTETNVSKAQAKAAPKSHSKEIGNGLSALIPGYIAPQSLDTSSLNAYKTTSLVDMIQQAERMHDASTKKCIFPVGSNKIQAKGPTSNLARIELSSSFKMGTKRPPDLSAGRGWFNMMSSDITDEIKTDIHVIRNRTFLDPKKFYKKVDSSFGTKHVQIGTVVEGSAEFYSSRLSNKERRSNITQELMADSMVTSYTKRKFLDLQQKRLNSTVSFPPSKKKKKMKRGH